MNTEQLLGQIKDLQEQISAKKEDLKVLFENGLKDLMLENKNVISIEMGLNNFDFNDGDCPYFDVYYDDLTLNLEEDKEYSGYPKNEELEKIRRKFADFFKQFDIDNFFEN